MKKTSLFESHVNLNAKIVDFAGWQMPIQYRNLKDEVLAVRNDIGVFDVSHMGEFFIHGPEAIDFIDFLVTNDIANSNIGKAIYSPLCREDGTVIDDLIVYKISNEEVLVCVNASNIDKDFNWFKNYSSKFNVTLTNRSSDYSLLAIQGPNTFKMLQSIDITKDVQDIEYYSLYKADSSDTPVVFARTGYTGEDGFEVFGPHAFIQKLWNELINKGVTPCGLGARDVLRLEVCFPLYGHELNDDITPIDANLKWTVKLNKNNFIGKSALVELQPRFQTVKFILDKGIPREGYKVFDDTETEVGEITSGTMSVMLQKGIALARVNKNLFNSKNNYFIDIRGKKYPAQLTTKAFVNGGHK